MAGIEKRDAGVESHNGLGGFERYHAYLRNVYNKVRTDSPTLSEDLSLVLAVKGVHDTAGPSRLTPTLLFFDVLRRMPIHLIDLPRQRERMRAL